MHLALAAYNNRIASLFEASDRFEIIEIENGSVLERTSIPIHDNCLPAMVQQLKQHKICALICGAISGCMYRTIESHGIQVYPWVTGDLEVVLKAYLAGNIENHLMPGCMGRHGRRMGRQGGRQGFKKVNQWKRGINH